MSQFINIIINIISSVKILEYIKNECRRNNNTHESGDTTGMATSRGTYRGGVVVPGEVSEMTFLTCKTTLAYLVHLKIGQ